MRMKKFILLLLGLFILFEAKAVTIDGINYELWDDGRASVNWAPDPSGSLIIPSSISYDGKTYTVTKIEYNAFYGCSGLTSVEIPNSVIYIGDNAFEGCSGLTNVIIGNSVVSIGESAFLNCIGLTKVEITDLRAWCNIDFVDSSSNPLSYAEHLYLNGEEIKDLTIPNTVTEIGSYVFNGCSGLTSLTIPNSVTEIGRAAFSGCSGLTSLTIPNSVTEIGNYAFQNCSGLTRVNISDLESWCNIKFEESWSNPLCYTPHLYLNGQEIKDLVIPNSVTSIGNNAFYNCSELTSLTIPNSVTEIGNFAFCYCSGLTSVTIPNSVTEIGNGAFSGCSGLTSIEIPNSVTEIEDYAFYGCSGLTNVEIPNSVTSIGWGAFSDCIGLTSIVIPNSITSIGRSAFEGCSGLKSIVIPTSVTNIGYNAFSGCSGLVKSAYPSTISNPFQYGFCIQYPANDAIFEDWVIYGKDKETIYFAPISLKGEFIVPNSVTSIGSYAFSDCRNLTSVEIPNSVTEIGNAAFRDCSIETLKIDIPIIQNWFSNLSSLKNLEIGNSVTEIENSAFRNCSSLKSVEIPNSITRIGYYAFYDCRGLTSVEIPNSITEIGTGVFGGCSSLTSVTIPNSVTEIGEMAFQNCSSLKSVEIPNSVTEIGKMAFQNCSSLKSVEIPNSVTEIGSYAFYGCSGLTSVTIPNSITSIGGSAFEGCSGLTSLTIPNSVTSIGNFAFQGCSGLTSLTIPNSVTEIGSGAFTGCPLETLKFDAHIIKNWFTNLSTLQNLEIGNSVTTIEASAFEGCSGLARVDFSDVEAWCNIEFGNETSNPLYYAKTLYLNNSLFTYFEVPKGVSEIKDYAFYNCKSLKRVEFPEIITSIGKGAFQGCESITNLKVPNSVVSIGEYAFAGCFGLTNVELGNSITSIGEYAFQGTQMDFFLIGDGAELLTWNGFNNIRTKNLYLGRSFTGPIIFAGLSKMEVGAFVDRLPENCFNNETLTYLFINPGSAIVIEDEAFMNCDNLIELTLPEDIAEIGAGAFKGTSLKEITIPGGIVGDDAFANCNLTSIVIGANVESIGERAFEGNDNAENVYATPLVPPAAYNNTFSTYDATLYVSPEALDAYQNSDACWNLFNEKTLITPERLEVSGPTTITGKPGETIQLTATILPDNVTLDRVLWSSTNPEYATVDNNGLVTIHNFEPVGRMARSSHSDGVCQIIATTLYDNSPVAVVTLEAVVSSIEYINSDNLFNGQQNPYANSDIYTLQGVCLKRNASQSDIDALMPGIYIVGGKKLIVR